MKYYAVHNPYGLNCSSDSIGWSIYEFDSKRQRKEWLDTNECVNGKYVAEVAPVKYLRKNFGRERVQRIGHTETKHFGKLQVDIPIWF